MVKRHEGEPRLPEVAWKSRYSTSRDNLITDFYRPALERSATYDRATGYFRSTIFSVVGGAMARFATKGGQMRLLCSPELTEEDFNAIQEGLDRTEVSSQAALIELETLRGFPQTEMRLKLLANLIASGHLELRMIVPEDARGIFHDKVGVFSDGSNSISFTGSINETWSAWHPQGNHESFEVFASWTSDANRVLDHLQYFETLWNGAVEGFRVVEPDDKLKTWIGAFADPEPLSALTTRADQAYETEKTLFDHQQQAILSWIENGHRGILKHATGSGKTITAINALREWLSLGKMGLVVVPSEILQGQWAKEIANEMKVEDPSILLAGAGNSSWRDKGLLKAFTRASNKTARVVIATIDTARTQEFICAIADPECVMIIVDEVHCAGASGRSSVLNIDAPRRIGLSATPERYGDPEGTSRIFDYFDRVLEPEFSLQDAIDAGRLAPYTYHPTIVRLDEDEEDDWAALSKQIGQLYARLKQGDETVRLKMKQLLVARSSIAKLARAKVPTANEIIHQHASDGEHWLVYCQQRTQLYELKEELENGNHEPLVYYSSMLSDKEATLDTFSREGGILLAIGCLDEGVDIPVTSHACILASSRNPRQFIQRRGRVLRVHPTKHHATIFDCLVVPSSTEGDKDVFDGLVYGELARAAEFASHASNQGAETSLSLLCAELGFDFDEMLKVEIEEEGDVGV